MCSFTWTDILCLSKQLAQRVEVGDLPTGKKKSRFNHLNNLRSHLMGGSQFSEKDLLI